MVLDGHPALSCGRMTYHNLSESHVNPFDLSSRVAIVTGGNGGLGLAMARGLARAGAAIAIAARDDSKGGAAVKELNALASRARFYQFDPSSASSCRKLIEAVTADAARNSRREVVTATAPREEEGGIANVTRPRAACVPRTAAVCSAL